MSRFLTNPRVGFGFLALLGVIIALLAYRQLSHVQDIRDQITRTHDTLTHLHLLLEDVVGAESSARGFVLTGRDEYLTFYEHATGNTEKTGALIPKTAGVEALRGSIQDGLIKLWELTTGDLAQQSTLEALEAAIRQKIEHMQDVVRITWANSMDQAQRYVQQHEGKKLMDNIRSLMVKAIDYEQAQLAEQMEEEDRALRDCAYLLIALACVLLLAMAMAILVLHMMLERDGELDVAVHDLRSFRDAVLNSSHFAIVGTDTAGMIRIFNPAAARMFGYTSDEIVGKEKLRRLHDAEESDERAKALSEELGDMVDAAFEVYVKKASMMGWEEGEWICRRKNGTLFPGIWTMTPTYDQRGYITGYLAVVRDYTEHKKIDAMRNELIATLSHEIENPLTSINGTLGLLLESAAGDLPQKAQQMLTHAYSHSSRLKLLMDDLLDIEKIESGQIRFEANPLAVDRLLEQTVAENKTFAEYHHVRLALRPDARDAMVRGDTARFKQAVLNLINNAIKFSPKDEKVVITSERVPQGIRISVVDSGPGIPETFKHKVFDKFAHADDVVSRQYGGMGLGLYLTQLIIDRMGGMIRFDSAPGRTEFSIILPELHASQADA